MSRTPFEARRTARSVTHPLSAVVVALLAVVAVGCGSSDPEPSATPSGDRTTSSISGGRSTVPGTTGSDGACISRIPGVILTADEAVVRFDPSQVCPGYVTVSPGTPVTFENVDTQVHTITITEGSLPDGAVVDTGTAGPGETWVRTFDTLGTFSFATDAIPTFRGAVEVTDGDGAH